MLLQSNSRNMIPKMGDYHQNLKKLHKYTVAGPADYNLPALFDNLNKTTDSHSALIKKNPQFDFARRDPVARMISKDHLLDLYGQDSPGPLKYKAVHKNTFEEFQIRNEMTKQFSTSVHNKFGADLRARNKQDQPGTFTTAQRFYEPRSQEWKK